MDDGNYVLAFDTGTACEDAFLTLSDDAFQSCFRARRRHVQRSRLFHRKYGLYLAGDDIGKKQLFSTRNW